MGNVWCPGPPQRSPGVSGVSSLEPAEGHGWRPCVVGSHWYQNSKVCRVEPSYKAITKGPFYQEQQGLGAKDWKCLS